MAVLRRDVATGGLELDLAVGGGQLYVAARGACLDVALDVAEVEIAAGGLADRFAVEIGDVDVAAGRTEVHVVGRGHGHRVARLEIVPVEHAPLVLVRAADAHVVAFLREGDLVVMDVGRAATAGDFHADLARAGGAYGDVADVGVDRQRASRLNVEGAANGIARCGPRGKREQREGQRDADGTDAMHDVTSNGCYYAVAGEKLAGRRRRRERDQRTRHFVLPAPEPRLPPAPPTF